MTLYGLPLLFVVVLWWASTGAMLYLIGLPRRSHRWCMIAATLVLLAAMLGLVESGKHATVGGAYAGFACALLIWGWHELSFLGGFVTGPRTSECVERKRGRARFWQAAETVIYHEFAILITAAIIGVLQASSANRTGLWTFLVLWIMRLSAKLNVYLGVPNLTEGFLPPHLAYLKGYFCRQPMNMLFPVSVTTATVVLAALVISAAGSAHDPFAATEATLVATLLALAVLEHWLLVLPLPSEALWSWGLKSRRLDMPDQPSSNRAPEALGPPPRPLPSPA